MDEQIARQVERLEQKIDRLSEAVGAIAVSVAEQRGSGGAQDVRLEALEKTISTLAPRVNTLESAAAKIAGLATLFATVGAALFSWVIGKLHL